MPRYYCDYCDTYLTHDSPSVRKQHNNGYKHKANVRSYYQQFEEQQNQSLIDQRIKEHLGQSGAFQVGGAFNQHMLAQRPRLPVPTPLMPMPVPQNGQMPVNTPLMMRPPILPRPLPVGQVYPPPQGMPQMVAPPGAPPPLNGVPRPPTGIVPTSIPGSTGAPTPASGAPPMAPPPAYQTNSGAPLSGGYDGFNMKAPAPEANH